MIFLVICINAPHTLKRDNANHMDINQFHPFFTFPKTGTHLEVYLCEIVVEFKSQKAKNTNIVLSPHGF